MVHEETLREVIDGGSSIIGSLVKEVVVHRNEMNAMERRKELELDLVREKNKAKGAAEVTASHEPVPTPTGLPPESQQAFEELKAREDCHTCRLLLEQIEQAPPDVQVKALTEWGEFRHASNTGASEAELRTILEESDTLEGLLDQAVVG